MTRNLELIAVSVVMAVLLSDRATIKEEGGSHKAMDQEVQLVWNRTSLEFGGRPQVHFMYSPAHGLSDIDFHPITARDWANMKAVTPDAVARLQVVKDTTLSQIQQVVYQIFEKGGYSTVVVTGQ